MQQFKFIFIVSFGFLLLLYFHCIYKHRKGQSLKRTYFDVQQKYCLYFPGTLTSNSIMRLYLVVLTKLSQQLVMFSKLSNSQLFISINQHLSSIEGPLYAES